jgi:porphobilinogen synthase
MLYINDKKELVENEQEANFLKKPYLLKRPRRNRKSLEIRNLIEETQIQRNDIVIPFFVKKGTESREELVDLPNISTFSLDFLLREIDKWTKKGFSTFALFPIIDKSLKDSTGTYSCDPSNFFLRAVDKVKKTFPHVCIIADIALDPFTSHGHDGVLNSKGEVANDQSLIALGQMSLAYAQAGVDILAPSDMMDGRVAFIRETLDNNQFQDLSILSYTAKYASSMYSPFRDVVGSSLKGGDKLTYQLNPANVKEALLEAALDEQEGADMMMVKPALTYLDIISKISKSSNLPVAAYHVSGEYAMVIAAHKKGWLDKDKALIEQTIAIKRAGASIIFTYAFEEIDNYLKIRA